MTGLKNLLEMAPFSLNHSEKESLFRSELQKLMSHHYENCPEYHRIIDQMKVNPEEPLNPSEVPFLPVSLFKKYDLSSIEKSQVAATLKSSGTSGQQVSKITIDKETGINQKKVLARITADFIGNSRLPMLILDSSSVMKDRAMFSARGAGILGFGNFGIDTTYAFDEKMDLNLEDIEVFLKKYEGQKILLFGFTFMVWQHFFLPLKKRGLRLALDNGILIHGGGWKKLQDQAVDTATFRKSLKEVGGISHIHNYYGMAEQTGSIFMECEQGHYHCSIFSDIFTRRNDFSVCNVGEKGMIEVISLLPHSYPGHALLTEDMGTVLGEDNCPCGRLGKYFAVHGRIAKAELRGCSDTYEP